MYIKKGESKMTWELGDTSKQFEVGNGGPETVSSGNGDHGGKSYRSISTIIKDGSSPRLHKTNGLFR